MIQNIIAYIIIGVAVGYTIYSVVKKMRNKNDNKSCSDCSCCSMKSNCKTKK